MANASADPSAVPRDSARRRAYEGERPDVQALVPAGARRVLELGCSTGALGAALKRRGIVFVKGIDKDAAYARQARERLDQVVVGDIEEYLRSADVAEERFDCLIAADVLEHLRDPWSALASASRLLTPGATVIVSVPNVLHFPGLLRLLVHGRWALDEAGVFDKTHLRWFTRTDAMALVKSAGLRVESIHGNYPGRGAVLAATRLLAHTPARRFLAVQWLVVGRAPG
ncbi:MAG TPA: class I SAM-dependent methyltransferase [Solirubrobacteraceae bacterium]|nr:class I SAM-dependent methyltransferase [Solirubrobacteraceae bacterium]